MFCKTCGTKLDGAKKFCTTCGTPSPVQPTEKKLEAKEPWTARRIIKYVLVIGIVALLLSAKFIVAVFNSVEGGAIETNNSALTAFDSGNSQDAITQLRQAADAAVTDANKANSLINLGYVYSSETRSSEALTTFKDALQYVEQNSFEYYLVSGEVALLENRTDAALENYNQAYSLKPNEFQINNALALFYLNTNSLHPQYEDYTKALTYALKADELSDLQSVSQNLALAYYFNENYSKAISILSGLTIDKDTYTAYFLGLSYLGIGEEANAKFYLKKAISAGVEMPQEIKDYAYVE